MGTIASELSGVLCRRGRDEAGVVEIAGRAFPFYGLVPAEAAENAQYRLWILEEAERSSEFRGVLWEMCSEDALYWLNTFVMTYNPRLAHGDRQGHSCIPFTTYPVQDELIAHLLCSMGRYDFVIKKSRQVGASWICLALLLWDWLFHAGRSHLLMSRTEEYVDKPGNPKALFQKIDFILSRLPEWMIPTYRRTFLHFENSSNESVIDGESTTGNAARGDVRGVIVLDEFSSFGLQDGFNALSATQSATNCRWFNSTPSGSSNAYAKVAHMPDVRSMTIHWSQFPPKRIGLYRANQLTVEVLDREYEFPVDYPFVRDGKLRSPWYDEECRRTPIPSQIAEQHDIDFRASGAPFFDSDVLRRANETMPRPPYRIGSFLFDTERARPLDRPFEDDPNGSLKLWIHPDAMGRLPDDRRFAIGVDVAAGTGASNSCIAILDAKAGEKVGSFVSSRISEADLAIMAVGLCRWFGGPDAEGAFLIWEANGPGRTFGNRVLDLGYQNIYFRANEDRLSRPGSDYPGWVSSRESKKCLLNEYQLAIARGLYQERDAEALEECDSFEYQADGSVVHTGSVVACDPGSTRENHGDRVVASALAVKAIGILPRVKPEKQKIPPNCVAARHERARRLTRESELDWFKW